MCTTQVLGAQNRQQRALDPLKVELQMIVSLHVGTGNQIQVICKIASILNHISLQPPFLVWFVKYAFLLVLFVIAILGCQLD